MALALGIKSGCQLYVFLKCLFQPETKHESVRELEVINLEESPRICCPRRPNYSQSRPATPSPGCWCSLPLSGRVGATLCPQKWSSIPNSAQKMYSQCVCTKCRKIPRHGKKATEEMLLVFTDRLPSVKHRAESPMSCTDWTMNFSEKYYLTTKVIKPACQPVSKGNINLSSSFRSSFFTDNAGKTTGLLFWGFCVSCYWVWCKSHKINHPICFQKLEDNEITKSYTKS